MAKRGLGKTSGRHGSRPDTRVATAEEARPGQVSRAAPRSGGQAELPPAAAGAAREAEELQAFIGHGPARTADEARLLTDFFSVPPPAPELEDLVLEEPVRAQPRAMWLTMGLLGASLALIGSYWTYQQLYVPQPVELGSDEPVMVLESPLPDLALPAAVSGEVAPSGAAEDDKLAFAAAPADPTEPGASAPADLPESQPQAAAVVALGATADAVTPPAVPTPTETQVNAATQAAPAAQPEAAAAVDSTGAAVQPGSGQGATQPAAAATPGIAAAPPEAHAALPGESGSSPGSSVARDETAAALSGNAGPAASALPPSAAVDGVGSAEPARAEAAPSFDVLLEQAESLSRRGQSAEAVAAFERALQRQPGAAAALAGKAYAHLNLNDQRSAKALAEQAVAADPTSSRAWIVLGAAEELLGSRSAAQAAYRQCAAQGVGRYVDECRKLVR